MAVELKHWLEAHGDFIEDKQGATCELKRGSFDPKTREFEAIASTDRIDRDTEIVVPKAFREHLSEFKQNPTMLFAHNPFEPPIGSWPKITLLAKEIPVVGKLRPEGDDAMADNMALAIASGFMRTVSIGFRIFEREAAEYDDDGKLTKPRKITKAALYEISLVNIPSNVDASIRVAKMLAEEAFPDEVVRTIFAPPASDLAVLKRAAVLLKRYGDESIEGKEHVAEMVAAVKQLREHVIGLADDEKTDFGRLRALRELTEDVKNLRSTGTQVD